MAENLGEVGSSCAPEKCRGGDFFSPGPSLMESLSYPFGVVNERFTCCTYLALPGATVGGLPPYCRRFMAPGTLFGAFPAFPAAGGVGTNLTTFCDDANSLWDNPFALKSSVAHEDHGTLLEAGNELVHIAPGDHGPGVTVQLLLR